MNTHDFIIGPTDTDSVSFCKKDGSPFTKEELDSLLKEINELSPDLITWEDDGYYKTCIAVKAKNYIMRKHTGETYTKGSAFKSSTKELALRELMTEIVNEMLEENNAETIKNIYQKYINEAKNITDIQRWCVKKTYTERIENSDRANETKVMDAINEGLRTGKLQSIQQGDKIYLYQTIDGMKQKMVKGEPAFYKRTVS